MAGRGELLREVEAFMARYEVVDTQFGAMAVGSSKFVFDLRKGRQPRPKTIARCAEFMALGNPWHRFPKSRFARKYALTVRRNAEAEKRLRQFLATDPLEQAKTFVRRQGFNCFAASVNVVNPRARRALAGKIAVAKRSGTEVLSADEFMAFARRLGWKG